MDELGWVHQVHVWNARVCPPLGFLLNFLFVWLVLHRTPKEMRTHSRILLQTCAFDILILFTTIFGMPLTISAGNVLMLLYEGYLANLIQSFPFLHYKIYNFIFYLQLFAVTTQFAYRYLLFNRNIEVSFLQYLQLLLLPFFAISISMTVFSLTTNSSTSYEANEFEKYHEYWHIFVKVEFENENVWPLTEIAIIFCCYGFTTFFGINICRFVNSQGQLSERTKHLNRQLTLTLILLAAYPFYLMVFEIGFIVVFDGILTDVKNPNLAVQLAIHLQESWLPLVNPLISILTNKPYRDAIFCCRSTKIQPQVVQAVQQQASLPAVQ